jgi:hypothetical protein
MEVNVFCRDASGRVVSIRGRFNAEATNFSKTKKTTWLSAGVSVARLYVGWLSLSLLCDGIAHSNYISVPTRPRIRGCP